MIPVHTKFYVNVTCGSIVFGTDCIGSAFNVKGVMQCPNCRKIEKGQWLYADSGRSFPEINFEDLISHEDFYDLTYPESVSFTLWCNSLFEGNCLLDFRDWN